ncbi:hypothetical protein H2199_007687 [Coniosporium tulheliwenetii]|uniref:Uncharacterized protein n=1 Tax=Coniosporium tulheliwenetii TaxID=3383036 RepID=A0ACC2YNS4_9PEZI|nr:hypothetical protein H2199_007687 [Cladosporium sp. JES 115]
MRKMFTHKLRLESQVFSTARRNWSTCWGGLLWAGHVNNSWQLLKLLSLIKEVNFHATIFLLRHFSISPAQGHLIHYGITMLWLLFATTPACSDRVQEPWNYYQFLSAYSRQQIDDFLTLLAKAILKKFPIPWLAAMPQRLVDELIISQIELLVAKRLGLPYLQRGLRNLREQVFAAERPRPKRAFGRGDFWNYVYYDARLRFIYFDSRSYTVTFTGTRLNGSLLAGLAPGPGWQPDMLQGMGLVNSNPTVRLDWRVFAQQTIGQFGFQAPRLDHFDYARLPGTLGIAYMFDMAEWRYERAEEKRVRTRRELAAKTKLLGHHPLAIKRKHSCDGDEYVYDYPKRVSIFRFSFLNRPSYNSVDWITIRMARLSLEDTGKEKR